MIFQRTKEALKAKKASGVILGKPKGCIQKSIFDEHKDTIIELLGYGVPISKIVKNIGVGTRQSLGTYIKKRGIL